MYLLCGLSLTFYLGKQIQQKECDKLLSDEKARLLRAEIVERVKTEFLFELTNEQKRRLSELNVESMSPFEIF
jgi:hypothetical protein